MKTIAVVGCIMFPGTCQCLPLLAAKLLGRMRSIYFILTLSMLTAVDVVNGFFISQAPLLVRQYPQHSAGKPSMIFGGGGKSSAKGGIVVKVLQKTGFKETEIILPGKTNLRKALLENKIDVYPLQGKLYNCGGGGSCGTCAVNVVDGAKNCSPKSPGEKKLLEKKPDSYRLSCCTMVSGPIKIQTKP